MIDDTALVPTCEGQTEPHVTTIQLRSSEVNYIIFALKQSLKTAKSGTKRPVLDLIDSFESVQRRLLV